MENFDRYWSRKPRNLFNEKFDLKYTEQLQKVNHNLIGMVMDVHKFSNYNIVLKDDEVSDSEKRKLDNLIRNYMQLNRYTVFWRNNNGQFVLVPFKNNFARGMLLNSAGGDDVWVLLLDVPLVIKVSIAECFIPNRKIMEEPIHCYSSLVYRSWEKLFMSNEGDAGSDDVSRKMDLVIRIGVANGNESKAKYLIELF